MTLGTMPYGHAGFSAGSKGLIVYWPGQPVWGDTASGFLDSRSGLILNGGHTNDASFGFFSPSIAEGCLDIKGSLALGFVNAVSRNVTASASGLISTQVGSINSSKYQINLTGGATTADLAAGQVVSNATSNTIITNIFSATAFETSSPISGNITITGLPCRPIRVDDNIYSGEDYAIISGHITGEAGLLKWGNGRLELPYFNSYSGPTQIQGGTLAVGSLGSSEFNGPSSLGLTLNAATDSSAVYMGVSNAVSISSSATLAYKGIGETSNRKILLYGPGIFSIDADGTGPLVLTNLVNSKNVSSNSSKTLQLRGSNLERNRILSNLEDTSNLPNGKLAVNITSSLWSLEGNSTYSGTTTLFTGAYLGLGSNSCIGLSNLSCTNGTCTLEAINGSRTLNNILLTSSITYFVGDNNLKFNPPMLVSNTSISTITNTISSSSNLFIGGMHSLYEANSSITFNGLGNTRIEGDITRSTETYKWSVTKADSGNLVFAGNTSALSSITVSAGNLIFESANATTYGNLTLATGGVNFKGAKVNIKGNFTLNGGSIRLGS
jgi:fibronectin-binding autotransporter adhesin